MKYELNNTRLRPVRADDAKISIAWRNDPEIRDMALGYRYPVTTAMEDAWYAKALSTDNKDVFFAIEDISDGAFVGIVSLTQVDLVSANAFFGIVIGDRARQGRGLGRDALGLTLRYGFQMLRLNRVMLHVPAYNNRATALYESTGFKLEGLMREQVYLDGRFHDVRVMGLLAREFAATVP